MKKTLIAAACGILAAGSAQLLAAVPNCLPVITVAHCTAVNSQLFDDCKDADGVPLGPQYILIETRPKPARFPERSQIMLGSLLLEDCEIGPNLGFACKLPKNGMIGTYLVSVVQFGTRHDYLGSLRKMECRHGFPVKL